MDLRDYLGVLARRRVTIIVVTLVVAGAAIAAGVLSADQTTSRAVAAMPAVRADGVIAPMAADVALERELEIARSQQVLERAAKWTGESPADLRLLVAVNPTAATSKGTIAFTTTDSNPERAAELSNAVATAYVEVSNGYLLADLERYRDAVRAGSAGASDETLAFLQSLGDAPLDLTELSVDRAATALDVRLADLSALLDMESSHAQLVGTASPGLPEGGVGRNAVLGLTLGLFLGVASALVQEQVDDRVRGADALRDSLPGVPVFDATGSCGHAREDALRLLAVSLTAGRAKGPGRLAAVTPTAAAADPRLAAELTAAMDAGEGATVNDAGALLESAQIGHVATDTDGVVLVVAHEQTRLAEVEQSVNLLGALGLPLRAVVLVVPKR